MNISSLRQLLRSTAPCRLTGRGKFKGFQRQQQGHLIGHKIRGLTKLLKSLESTGTLPSITRSTNGRPDGSWRGRSAGRRRGSAVDAQLSAIVNGVRSKQGNQFKLTRAALAAMKYAKVRPVIAQRGVLYPKHNEIGTAIDIMALRGTDELVLIELKTGHDNGRTAVATHGGVAQTMKTPLTRVTDCIMNRHMTQLAATHHMFTSETETITKLQDCGVNRVSGMLLYVNDEAVDFVELPVWWKRKSASILKGIV